MRIGAFILLFCLFTFVSQTYAADPDLVVYLPMDEGEGNQVADASGNAHDGTIVGDAEWIDGKHGRALEVTTAGEIQIPDADALDMLAAITIEVWVRQKTHQSTGVIQKGEDWPGMSYLLQPWSDQSIYFGVNDLSSRAITKPGDYPLGEWYHLAGTFDGEILKVYIDGEEKASAPAPVDTIPDTTEPLKIGNRLAGAIDDFALYSRALTAEEIRRDMDGIVLSMEKRGKLATTWASIRDVR